MTNANPRGSVWNRWDPHLHAPGTVLNNQYSGSNPWGAFLTKIEASAPRIKALGITDYFSVDLYEEVVSWKQKGRLKDVDLIFPNVELRIATGTTGGSAINVHLLVSPDDAEHLNHLRSFLVGLQFEHLHQPYRCEKRDLIRLGKAFDPSVTDERRALEIGTTQFKVDFSKLREAWRGNSWAMQNILIAVAGGSNDGTSGLQGDSSFAATRKEIERFAHIIFSSQPKQREFWLGHGAANIEQLNRVWNGCKPCLHGSDAHDLGAVGSPDVDRLCWIKGDVTFESLRQACIEPGERAYIGLAPPKGALPSQVVAAVTLNDASWLVAPTMPLNPGLVAIIGARGSGKTALAEFIAAGGYALSSQLDRRSFISRAAVHLVDTVATNNWESGENTSCSLEVNQIEASLEGPRIQYLSQQFVDHLCSSEGITDELISEIERVIFNAHLPSDRMGATTFKELLDLRAEGARAARQRQEESLAEYVATLDTERQLQNELPTLKKQLDDKSKSIATDKKDRQALVKDDDNSRVESHELVTSAISIVQGQIDSEARRLQSLQNLRSEVRDVQKTKAPGQLAKKKIDYADAGLSDEQWTNFLLDYSGDVELILTQEIAAATAQIRKLKGPTDGEARQNANAPAPVTAYINANADLKTQTLTLLTLELNRLRALIGVDKENSKKYTMLSEKISREEAALAMLERRIKLAEGAAQRIKDLIAKRLDAYKGAFEAVIAEENVLKVLYAPLQANLKQQGGTLSKLAFSIRRTADIESWAAAGENLLDLRKAGPFKGKGALLEAAKKELQKSWESAGASDIAAAMTKFREEAEAGFVQHSPVDPSNRREFLQWVTKLSGWLYGTSHIKVTYGIQYDGVEIEQLSQGTRGIVLLLLYLAIDNEDDRPLLIDQPEENLDPKSIFDELVGRFREARRHRQIIIVTHNANLVVNTDADQVIVASCGPHRPGTLPEMKYESGGLENSNIRQHVCDILEGGTSAFAERAKRLRIRLPS